MEEEDIIDNVVVTGAERGGDGNTHTAETHKNLSIWGWGIWRAAELSWL